MVLYQNADGSALDELVRRVSPQLLRYFSASRVSREDAEDMLQNCWMRIHRSRHTYRATEPVMPWLYAIARHTRLDAWRRKRRRGAREALYAEVPEPARHPGQDRAQDGTAADGGEEDGFGQMVAALPDAQREVLVMLKVAGMSLEDVARATSTTVGAVKQKAHRAYVRLRRILEKDKE